MHQLFQMWFFLVYFMEDFSLVMYLQLVQYFYKVRLCNLCHILI